MRLVAFLSALTLTSSAIAQHKGETPPALVWNKLKGNCPASLTWASLRGKTVVVSITEFGITPEEIIEWSDVVQKLQSEQAVFLDVVTGSKFLIDQALKQAPVPGCILVDDKSANRENFKLPNFPRTVVVDEMGVIAGYSRGDPDEEAIRLVLNHQLETGLSEVSPPTHPYDSAAGVDPVPSYQVHISLAEPAEMPALGQGGPDMYVTKKMPLKWIVADLWKTPLDRIVSLDTLDEQKYDVTAHIPVADGEQLIATVRAAVEDRFGLRVSKEERQQRVYVMTSAGASARLQPSANGETWMMGGSAADSTEGTAVTMQEIANMFADGLDVPVIDGTGMKGKFNYWASSKLTGAEAEFDIAGQLGLKLTEEERPIEMLVVRKVP